MNENALVLDVGSGSIKAGLSENDIPSLIIPSLIGKPKYKPSMVIGCGKFGYIGNDAMKRRGILELQYPIQRGLITKWDEMELLFQYLINEEMKIETMDYPILITEPVFNSEGNRERMSQLIFEQFDFQGLYFALQPVLSLYASGRSCGVVLNSGEGLSQIVPIHCGYPMPQSVHKLHLGGWDLTEYLRKLLREGSGAYCHFQTSAEFEMVRDLKEKYCRVSNERDHIENVRYFELPDGSRVREPDTNCVEALFNPELIDIHCDGIHKMIFKSISKCEIDNQRDMFGNIVLSGGNSLIPGIRDRISDEINKLAPQSIRVSVINMQNLHTEWIGAVIMTMYSEMATMWFTKDQYNEYGFSMIHRTCLTP